MEDKELKKAYEALKKKHDLPEFDELDRNFEISLLEENKFMLREISRRIAIKLEDVCNLLENILQPETNLTGLYECKFFSDEEKAEIFQIFKRLMALRREAFEMTISPDDKRTAEFIKRAVKEWDDNKTEIKKAVINLKESWNKETNIKEDLEYLG